MTLAELKTGVNKLLQSSFPTNQYSYYGIDTVEGYEEPCFFTYLKPIDMGTNNYNTYEYQVALYIEYHQPEVDELDMLNKLEQIRKMFETYIIVSKRSVNVTDFDYEYIGTDKSVLDITIDLQWFEKIEHKQNEDIMRSFFYAQKVEMEE